MVKEDPNSPPPIVTTIYNYTSTERDLELDNKRFCNNRHEMRSVEEAETWIY